MGKKQGMDYMDNILREVIAGFSPDKARIIKETGKVLKKINSGLSKSRIRAKAVAGGSVAKGTFLKGDHDCDIFVKFSLKEYRNQDISLLLEKVLRKAFKSLDKVHGSRDYYHMKNEFKYEIVPVLDIRKSSQAVNVTDCSPLHVKWVNKFPKMKKEIMLTKAFCKSAGVYGAESYIQGFSGHVVDIIKVYYGGFLNLLKESKRWKKKEIIDYYKYHKGRAMFNLNRSKTQSPLIVIDPVQPDRNAAAALGEEKFELFRKKAAEFLKSPSKAFFVQEALDLEKIRKSAGDAKLIILDVESVKGKEDVAGAKLLKALQFIDKQLKMNSFNVKSTGWKWDKKKKAVFWIAVDKEDLSKKSIWEGPPVNAKMHYDRFKKVHKNTFEKNGKVYAEVDRKFVNAERFIKYLLGNDYIKDKVKKIILRKQNKK